MSFAPGVVQAVDADGNPGNGVQVTPGDIFAGRNTFVAANVADNAVGAIHYAAALLFEPAGVTGSGALLSATFRGAGGGHSAIAFTIALLASRGGEQIIATAVDGAIIVTGGATPTTTPMLRRVALPRLSVGAR